jgi:hypothetical protein
MELPFSALAQPGPDAMAIAAARLPGAGQRSSRNAGTHLSSKGIRIVFSHLEMPAREQQTKWSQRVEPEKEREIQDARFTAC